MAGSAESVVTQWEGERPTGQPQDLPERNAHMRNARSRVWVAGVVSAGLVGYFVSQGMAAGSGTPAHKAVAAGSHRVTMGPDHTEKLMTATFKTSKPEDLLIQVAAECSILTDLVLPGSDQPGATQTANARGRVRIWVTIDDKIVPIEDVSAPPQDPAGHAGGEADKITFCDRLHSRTIKDEEDPQDGLDSDRDYQDTKSANAFNWVRLNAGSGEHTVVVWGEFTTNFTTSTTGSTAKAIVGNRSLIIEPTKLANAAVIAENGTSNSGS